ncbi:MAG TPA: hypothetical protein VLI04_06510 [Nocardioidaceae bacterium]|nr:hypothetical protein [Nocardioidaceae bacterium]
MTELLWRAPARVSVSGPEGWAPAEVVDVHHRDGDAVVRVETWPVAADADLDELAARHFDPAETPARDSGLTPAQVLGSDQGRNRSVTLTGPDGSSTQALFSYAVRQGRFFAVTRLVPAADSKKAAEAAAIADSISVAAPSDIDEALLPLRPSGADFESVRDAWIRGTEVPESTDHVVTVEESFAAARHHGVAMLPGADTTGWNTLDATQRELVSGVAWRSLVARGATTDASFREALEIAASHDLIVVVTTRREGTSTTEWYAARPDRLVRIRPSEHEGQLLLTVHDTAALADLVVDEMRQGDEITASSVYRHDGSVVGREESWTADHTGDAGSRPALEALLPTSGN